MFIQYHIEPASMHYIVCLVDFNQKKLEKKTTLKSIKNVFILCSYHVFNWSYSLTESCKNTF